MDFGLILLTFVLAMVGTLALGLVFKWVDRKVTAMVQYRVGPPWYQPGVDILKLMAKENLMPYTAKGTPFLLAPIISVASTAAAAAILWRAVVDPGSSFVGDLIVVVYLLAIPAIMTIVGASASGNPSAAVGASREMKLLFSYELPLILVLMISVARSGWTFRLGEIIAAQQRSGSVVASISGVLALIVALLCMQAKLGQVPFDVAEAECEIMSGVYVEYSGPSLAYWKMTQAMMLALMPLVLIVVFWGGLTHTWWGVLPFLGKYVLLVALVTLIRNTNPRLRIDQIVRFFWFYLMPVAIVAAILALIGMREGKAWL
jgi:NADH-quinone oxidoreductase subunit H